MPLSVCLCPYILGRVYTTLAERVPVTGLLRKNGFVAVRCIMPVVVALSYSGYYVMSFN